MKFADLKAEAKGQLAPHYGFFLLLLLPAYILSIISGGSYVTQFSSQVSQMTSNANGVYNTQNVSSSGGLFSIFANVLLLSAFFVMIKVMRGQDTTFKGGFKKAFNIFTRGDYFFGAFMVGLLKYVYIFLWSLLGYILAIAAVAVAVTLNRNQAAFFALVFLAALLLIATSVVTTIKSLAYSQAQFIFRDGLDNDQPVSYNQAITKSRQLMDGHKGEFFLLILSFILWYLLGIITLGLANIFYVTPYTRLTFANYYVHLTENNITSAE
ncbi:DUF975 family protein [Nicoliella lavandulae]|uniref:DUF975 family protein n=1 Tax=Nicoliella lavandulae TaxID=3082954 RepID=A0ABU8SJV2_9LACO